MADLWNLSGDSRLRWERIVAASGIEQRHAVLPFTEIPKLTTAQRMNLYERFAPDLACRAAIAALAQAGVSAHRITDLIIVSCTGFSAPGVDVSLVRALGLPRTVRRTVIGFMGCFGAINGLRAAVGACAADPNAMVLMVCVELCSLHLQQEVNAQTMVASALFADGAAAAVLRSSDTGRYETDHAHAIVDGMSPALGRVTLGSSRLVDAQRDAMTWRITDAGFVMSLSRSVLAVLGRELDTFVRDASPATPATFVIHPGGPGILDAADAALRPFDHRGVACSRDVLRRFGNMSSGTVLFVLKETLRQGLPLPMMLLAFGPGLTLECVTLEK